MNKVPHRCLLAISVLVALGAAVPALAQDAPASGAVQLEEVKVTAQRREEQLQKTPMSLTVISGEQLDRMRITRLDDIKFVTPNIIIEQNTGTSSGAKIIMRGVGADESMFTNDPAVAIYIDDVYIPRQNGAMFDLYDVERIEVLRGPQGTFTDATPPAAQSATSPRSPPARTSSASTAASATWAGAMRG